MPFSWNEKKAAQNRHKHGVSFEEAKTCFYDPLGVAYADWVAGESREVLHAYSDTGRLLVVVFVQEPEGVFRLISARKATAHEAAQHAQGI